MPKPKPPAPAKIDKAEAFAYEYIRNNGNGTAAALAVFKNSNNNAASTVASEYLRKPRVQAIIKSHMKEQREIYDEFIKNSSQRLSIVVQKLIEHLDSPNLKHHEWLETAERLARISGFELSHSLDHLEGKRIDARAETAREIAGARPNGAQGGGNIDSRQTIFMLSPPPIPPGGVVPPALAEQWKALGWKPGIATEPIVVDN